MYKMRISGQSYEKATRCGFRKDVRIVKTKFKIILTALVLLWGIAFIQTCITRLYVSRTAFTQAFAHNQIQKSPDDAVMKDSRNLCKGNMCQEGFLEGHLTAKECKQLAQDIFRQFGGERVLESDTDTLDYYVAYGYTRGVADCKYINGKKINVNVAMAYEEERDGMRIVVGTPLINSDF